MTAAAVAPIVVAGAFELAKIGLQSYFEYMRIAGKTDAEIEQVYAAERDGFTARRPELLQDPV
jgi:hypothetical protein